MPFNVGKSFAIHCEHEKNVKPPKGRHAIIIKPGYFDDYCDHPSREYVFDSIEEMQPKGKVTMNMGVGPGFVAIALARLGASEVWAIDILDYCRDFTDANAKLNDLHKIIHTAGAIPEGKKFDIIVLNFPVLNVYKKLLSLAASALSESGVLFIESDNLKQQLVLHNGIQVGHIELGRLIEQAGLTVIKKETMGDYEFTWLKKV